MLEYQKFCSFEYGSDFEKIFISILREMANPECSFLNLPSNTCFSGCIKEILNCLKKEKDGIINSEYSNHLIINFYNWLLDNSLIKDYDFLFYSQLLQTLKKYIETPKFSKTEKYAFFDYINKSKIHIYRINLYNKIIFLADNNICTDESYKYIMDFISELLAMGNTYPFLWFVYNSYVDNLFPNFKALIDYLNCSNSDTYDIFVPIENFTEKDGEIFKNKKQIIEYIDDVYYCKVYAVNTLDFYRLIKENISRIESLFNISRFYNNTKIKFSSSLPIKVRSKYFGTEFEVLMSDILCYRSKRYGKNFIMDSIEVLDNVKQTDKTLYHRLLNVINYAEKDQDAVNPSSYVDNWISLETLALMGERGKGFDAVNKLIPKMLTAKFILDDANQKFQIIKNALESKKVFLKNLQEFIRMAYQGNPIVDYIDDPYIKIIAKNMADDFSSIENLKKLFDVVETKLSNDLLRIYILRNEYVHSSNLQAFSSMHAYELKHILAASIDEFFRLLKNRNSRDESEYGIIYDAFSEMIYKYEVRNTAFTILINGKKHSNSIVVHTDIETQNVDYETFVSNVLRSNTSLFKKYKKTQK